MIVSRRVVPWRRSLLPTAAAPDERPSSPTHLHVYFVSCAISRFCASGVEALGLTTTFRSLSGGNLGYNNIKKSRKWRDSRPGTKQRKGTKYIIQLHFDGELIAVRPTFINTGGVKYNGKASCFLSLSTSHYRGVCVCRECCCRCPDAFTRAAGPPPKSCSPLDFCTRWFRRTQQSLALIVLPIIKIRRSVSLFVW